MVAVGIVGTLVYLKYQSNQAALQRRDIEIEKLSKKALADAISLENDRQSAINALHRQMTNLKSRNATAIRRFKLWFGTDDTAVMRNTYEQMRRIKEHLSSISYLDSRGNHWDYISPYSMTNDQWREYLDARERNPDRVIYAVVFRNDNVVKVFADPYSYFGSQSSPWTRAERSRPSLLIHELSHELLDTKDLDSEPKDAAALASSDPTAAQSNAYNFQYYVTEPWDEINGKL